MVPFCEFFYNIRGYYFCISIYITLNINYLPPLLFIVFLLHFMFCAYFIDFFYAYVNAGLKYEIYVAFLGLCFPFSV